LARIVDNGATLQIGFGRVPNEMLRHLTNRRDLGIHSDVIAEPLADLVAAGAYVQSLLGARFALRQTLLDDRVIAQQRAARLSWGLERRAGRNLADPTGVAEGSPHPAVEDVQAEAPHFERGFGGPLALDQADEDPVVTREPDDVRIEEAAPARGERSRNVTVGGLSGLVLPRPFVADE
jgi:hypothetical protein